MRAMHLAFAAGLSTVFAAAAPASAAPSSARAAMLPPKVDGEINPGWVDKIEEGITKGLIQGGVQVVSADEVTEATGGVGECANEKCFKFVAGAAEAGFLIRTKITFADRNYEIGIDIIDGGDGSLAASSTESCQLCGLGEVEELVVRQAAALRQKVDALSLEPAYLSVTTDPPGAMVSIDGEQIGPAPLEHELQPGPHTASVSKRGYVEQSRKMDAVRGVREELTFKLLPKGGADDGGDAKKDWRDPTGWALVAAGTAVLASGIAFIVLDERPYKAKCEGPDIDIEGNCRQLWNTLVPGATFTGTGGVMVVSGAAMLISARLRRDRRTSNEQARLRSALLYGRF